MSGSLALPLGFAVALNHRTKVRDGGRCLIGGSPIKVVYLKAAAAAAIAAGPLRVTDSASAKLVDRLLETGIVDPVVAELPEGDPTNVTYVIPVRNRPHMLERLLASIGPARVIVVDDASTDPLATERIAMQAGAAAVLLTKNVGPAMARNEGLRRVITPYVAFVDSDVVMTGGAIELMLRHFIDPRVALVAPRVVGLPSGNPNWISRYEDARSSLDLGRRPAIVRPRGNVTWVSGTTLLARTQAVRPGFSAEMRSGEDVDLVWRLAELGHRVRYEPAATVLHQHRTTVVAWMRRKAFYGTGAAGLAVRHPRNIAPAVQPPWTVALILSLGAQRWWSIPVSIAIGAVTVWRLGAKLRRSERPTSVAVELAANGALAALVQSMALLLRHWWPLSAILLPFSARLRRAAVLAHIADVAMEYARTRPDLDPLRFGLARRLDDLAYGAGVWFSVLKNRSIRALLPDFRSTRSD